MENIGFSYGTKPILDSVSLHIPTGKIWALIGRSGVGKTTLLQIVAGLFSPTNGIISISGREQLKAGRVKGVVFQEDSLLGWLTVEDNVLFPQHTRAPDEERIKARSLLNEMGLSKCHDDFPSTLSTGMRKRVEFARALFVDHDYLLADEPFGPLDALTRRSLWKLWQELRRREPRTGILSTHDPEEAIRLCDVVITLTPGNPARLGQPLEVPSHLSNLAPNETTAELLSLKERIVCTLNADVIEP